MKMTNLFLEKIETKNDLRGGDSNDVNPNHGNILIDQLFYSPING